MKVISLFTGAGGMDIGFIEAGHTVVWANDIDEDSLLSYKNYFSTKYGLDESHIVVKDIKNVPIEDIPDGDIVIGGFPCQGFSIANPYRKTEDSRNELYLELKRVIAGKTPKVFVAENVAGLHSIGGYETAEDKKNKLGRVFKVILKELGEVGYKVKWSILDAKNYGVPQSRKRIVIVGVRNDIDYDFQYPIPTHGKTNSNTLFNKDIKPYVTLGEVIQDLPEEQDASYKIPNHTGTSHKVRINGYIGNRKTNPNQPSPTIVGRGGGTGGPVIIPHPNGKRRLTVRECARLQSFPDDFVFYGSNSSCYRQIGNAVPWLLAYNVAKNIPKDL